MNAEAAAAAALAICESMLLALRDKGTLSLNEAKGLLSDAADAHRHMGVEAERQKDEDMHRDAVSIIERIRDENNSMHIWREHRGRKS